MDRPARLLAALILAAVANSAAAAPARYVPADPRFVVANVSRAAPDAALRARIVAWQARPANETLRVALAEAFFERAHAMREPMFVGRAEAVLAPAIAGARPSAAERRLFAYALQYRHEFERAAALLDGVLAASPRDAAARSQRASVRLVRGDFSGARADCAQLVAAGDASATIGIACLAEALAGLGDLDRARALLATFPLPAASNPASHAYLLTVRAELAERAGDSAGAFADYGAALKLAPESDPIRAAFADLLLERGEPAAARSLADVDRPSLALLVRQALGATGGDQPPLRSRVAAWLELERARGDAAHRREAAMLALDAGEIASALEAARANFQSQRELADVRILARAAAAARDADAQRTLRAWLDATGFADVVTEKILAAAARS